MSKRFTYSAGQATRDLARTQAQIQRLERRLKGLRAEEANLKSYSREFYDEGRTEVEYPDGAIVEVSYSSTDRFILDQQRVQAFYALKGKRVPYMKVEVVSFKAKEKQ